MGILYSIENWEDSSITDLSWNSSIISDICLSIIYQNLISQIKMTKGWFIYVWWLWEFNCRSDLIDRVRDCRINNIYWAYDYIAKYNGSAKTPNAVCQEMALYYELLKPGEIIYRNATDNTSSKWSERLTKNARIFRLDTRQ